MTIIIGSTAIWIDHAGKIFIRHQDPRLVLKRNHRDYPELGRMFRVARSSMRSSVRRPTIATRTTRDG